MIQVAQATQAEHRGYWIYGCTGHIRMQSTEVNPTRTDRSQQTRAMVPAAGAVAVTVAVAVATLIYGRRHQHVLARPSARRAAAAAVMVWTVSRALLTTQPHHTLVSLTMMARKGEPHRPRHQYMPLAIAVAVAAAVVVMVACNIMTQSSESTARSLLDTRAQQHTTSLPTTGDCTTLNSLYLYASSDCVCALNGI